MRDLISVQDGKIAKVFSNTSQRHMLLELAGHERSLQRLANILRMPLSLAHYHVGRLLALGLVEITRREPRAGKPIKHYRAVARSFFVPAHLASRSPSAMLYAELRTALERAQLRRSDDNGTVYFVDDQMRPRMRRMQGRARRVAVESWGILHVTDKDAHVLYGEMKALFSRYEGLAGDSAATYLAHFAIVPRGRKRTRN